MSDSNKDQQTQADSTSNADNGGAVGGDTPETGADDMSEGMGGMGTGQSWGDAGVDTGGGMASSADTASGGNWGDNSGLSDNAAGKGAGHWIDTENSGNGEVF